MLGDVGLNPVLTGGRERHKKLAAALLSGPGRRETKLLRLGKN
jgi:hypothetical protein